MTESYEMSTGRQLALQTAERLRSAQLHLTQHLTQHVTQDSVEMALPDPTPATIDERQVYVNNPGHIPYLDN